MEDFVHNAGHELKTPLSVISGDLQMMQAKKVYDKDFTQEMLAEVDKLNVLIEGLVDMANIHSASEKEEINLYNELQDVLKTYQSQIEEKQIQVEFKKQYHKIVVANKGYVQIFLWNLLSNAIKYNKKWGKILCNLSKSHLIIEDTGIGIENIHHSKIWKRFYKVQNGNTQGSWIWLSLVKRIADVYHWNMIVESEKGAYTRFTVSFK